MPEYSYQCNQCDVEFEMILSMASRDEPTKLPCSNCRKEDCIEQVITKAPLFKQDIHGEVKHNAQMKNTLSRIKRANKGSNIEV